MTDAEPSDPAVNPLIPVAFEQAAAALVSVGQRLWQQGYCPATSSNFSLRLDSEQCAITVSGRDKGCLQTGDIMRVDMQGRSLDGQTPSAETLLHTRLYLRDTNIGAVLHTHSLKSALVSMHHTGPVELEGLELLKALRGVKTHLSRLEIPVFDNTQDIATLAEQVDNWMCGPDRANGTGVNGTVLNGIGHAYLIKGHGLYTWGRDLDEAVRHIEALEYLLDYFWHQMLLKR